MARRKPPIILSKPPEGSAGATRLVQRNTTEAPIRLGAATGWRRDIYHRILVLRWHSFLLGGVALYLLLNVMFAGLYLAQPGGVDHARPGSFVDAFFFSIQTMATIGYGVLSPVGLYANIIVTIETMVALVLVAFTTGLTFARFSRPTARVNFSRFATVAPYNGVPTLAVRLSNNRRNQILEADVGLTLVRNEVSAEGQWMRRFYDLPLSRGHTPIFSLTFTAMHPIDAQSPLHGIDVTTLRAQNAEILVTVTGLDETMSQTIHARASYIMDELRFGHRFVDIFGFTPEGRIVIDYTKFDEVVPVDHPRLGPQFDGER